MKKFSLLKELYWLLGLFMASLLGIWAFIGYGFLHGGGPYMDWANFFACGLSILSAAVFLTDDWPLIWLVFSLVYISSLIFRWLIGRKRKQTL